MDIHKNARLTLRSREALVREVLSGMRLTSAARRFLVTPKTAAKWVARYRADGARGLLDRSSRPLFSPLRLPEAVVAQAQTYLLAGEVFPTAVRGQGAGFAAAFAKIGAVMTAFLFPILLSTIGTRWLLYILIVASVRGAVVTWSFRIETTGVNLDRIGEEASESEPTRRAA